MAKLATKVSDALKVAGLDLDQLVSGTGGVLTQGEPYLVGSLAAGLGNKGSDVDIHLFRDDLTESQEPRLLFVGDVLVDVEVHPTQMPCQMAETYAGVSVVEHAIGAVSLTSPPSRRERRRLARWMGALPLFEAQNVFDGQDRRNIGAVLVRSALNSLVETWALASVSGRSSLAAEATSYLWRRSGRQLLELACRAAGDFTPSEKWLPARAARWEFTEGLVGACWGVTDEKSFRRAAVKVGLPVCDPLSLTRISRDPEAKNVNLAGRRMTATRHGRVVPARQDVEGGTADVLERIDADGLLASLTTSVLVLHVDDLRLGEVLA